MAVATIVALSSCNNDDAFETNSGDTNGNASDFVVTIESEASSRATLVEGFRDKAKAEWEVGDQIKINGSTYTASTAGTSSTFKCIKAVKPRDGKYMAYFPASLQSSSSPALPSEQTYTNGKFNMPMYAESTDNNLCFKNICAVLAIKVTRYDIAKVKSIIVKSDLEMWGDFTISDNKAVVREMGRENKYTKVKLVCDEAVQLDNQGTTFYIAVPAKQYNFLNIYLSEDGTTYKEAMATKHTPITLERSKIYNIDYSMNAIQMWENGPLFATENYPNNTEKDRCFLPWTYSSWNGKNVEDYVIKQVIGDNWRLPTTGDYDNLISNTVYEWIDDAKGVKFSGKGDYMRHNIFLPALGYRNLKGESINSGTEIYYWCINRTYKAEDQCNALRSIHENVFDRNSITLKADESINVNYACPIRAILEDW